MRATNRAARYFGLFALVLGGVVLSAMDKPASVHAVVIDVVAANWKFTPATITVPVGQTTTLHLTSTSGIHGIKSDDLGIPNTTIEPAKYVDVTFTPAKAGTYQVHCSVFCGPGHANQYLTIVVK